MIVYDIYPDVDATTISAIPAKSAAKILEMQYERLADAVPKHMLPPREALHAKAIGSGGMGTAFTLARPYDLSGWVLKLTVDAGEAAVAAIVVQAGGEIPGLVPVQRVLSLGVSVVDSGLPTGEPQPVFAVWRRLVVPVYDFVNMPMEDDFIGYEEIADAAMHFGAYAETKTAELCEAFDGAAPGVTNRYMRDPKWIRYVASLARDEEVDGSMYTKAGRALAAHLATYLRVLSASTAYGLQTLGSQLVGLLGDYDIVLCDLAARNLALMFPSERSKAKLVVFDFGVPRFLTKRHDNVEIDSI
jgi:hypothetical protein